MSIQKQKGYFVFRKKNLEAKSDFLKKGDNKGYFVLPGAIMADPGLNPYEKLVYAFLLSCVRAAGRGKCNPSDETIGAYCGISHAQVKRARVALKEKAWLNWERTGSSNEYRLFSTAEHDDLVTHASRINEAATREVLQNPPS